MKHKNHLTFETSCANNDLRTSSNGSGNDLGQSLPGDEPKRDDKAQAPPSLRETKTIPLTDRNGQLAYRQLTREQWTYLHERRLVELVYTNRKRTFIQQVRLGQGVSVAEINSALCIGMRSALPRAEDNKTTVERRVEGGGIYYDHIHVEAWNPDPAKRK